MVNTTCAVRECSSSSRTSKNVRFHQFPQDEERIKQWIEVCDRADLFDRPPDFLKHTYMCSLHFEPSMYGKRILKKNAVPTLLLPSKNKTSIAIQTETLLLLKRDPHKDNLAVAQIDGRSIVSRVYHYLEQEYHQLESATSSDLSSIQDTLQRTARATGLPDSLVKFIMEQEVLLGSSSHAASERRMKVLNEFLRGQNTSGTAATTLGQTLLQIKGPPENKSAPGVASSQTSGTAATTTRQALLKTKGPSARKSAPVVAASQNTSNNDSSNNTVVVKIEKQDPDAPQTNNPNNTSNNDSSNNTVVVKIEKQDPDAPQTNNPNNTPNIDSSNNTVVVKTEKPDPDAPQTKDNAKNPPAAKKKIWLGGNTADTKVSHVNVYKRKEIIRLHYLKYSVSQIAHRLYLSRNSVRLWINRYKETGTVLSRSYPPNFVVDIALQQPVYRPWPRARPHFSYSDDDEDDWYPTSKEIKKDVTFGKTPWAGPLLKIKKEECIEIKSEAESD